MWLYIYMYIFRTCSRSTSSPSFIFLVWMRSISSRPVASGMPMSISRSNRPKRRSAGSIELGRLVAAITITWDDFFIPGEKCSISNEKKGLILQLGNSEVPQFHFYNCVYANSYLREYFFSILHITNSDITISLYLFVRKCYIENFINHFYLDQQISIILLLFNIVFWDFVIFKMFKGTNSVIFMYWMKISEEEKFC